MMLACHAASKDSAAAFCHPADPPPRKVGVTVQVNVITLKPHAALSLSLYQSAKNPGAVEVEQGKGRIESPLAFAPTNDQVAHR
jgi:hypothetical protein